jgi:hypothetical protein
VRRTVTRRCDVRDERAEIPRTRAELSACASDTYLETSAGPMAKPRPQRRHRRDERSLSIGAAAGCRCFCARPARHRGDRATRRQPAGPGRRVRLRLCCHLADRHHLSAAALARFISLPDPGPALPTTPAAVVTAPETVSVIRTGEVGEPTCMPQPCRSPNGPTPLPNPPGRSTWSRCRCGTTNRAP